MGVAILSIPTIVTGYDWTGVIFLVPSGVVYEHQSGGYACLHPSAEGVFAPLPAGNILNVASWSEEVSAYFTGEKWYGGCVDKIDGETADFLDGMLARLGGCRAIRVNREQFCESWEAWISVTIGACTAPERKTLEHKIYCWGDGFPDICEAMLIWPNSDWRTRSRRMGAPGTPRL